MPPTAVHRFVLLLLLLLVPSAYGVQESEGWLVQTPEHGILKRLGTELGWEEPPVTSGVTIIVRQGGTYVNVVAIGPVKADARTYAEALERGTGHRGARFSQENDCAAAAISWNDARFGRREGTTAIDLDVLSWEFTSLSGREAPKIAVLAAGHTEGGLPLLYEARRWRYSAPARGVSRVSATLPPLAIPALLAFAFLVPLGGAISFAWAILGVKNVRVDRDVRRRRFLTLIRTVLIALIAVHAPLAIFMLFGGWLYAVGDLWFGTWSAISFVTPFVLAMPLPLILLLPLANRMERRLFSTEPEVSSDVNPGEAKNEPVPPPKIEPTGAERLRQRWTVGVILACVVVGIIGFGLFSLVPPKTPWRPIVFPAIMVLVVVGPQVAPWLVKRFGPKIEEKRPAPDLEAVARELAGVASAKIKSVQIDVTPLGRGTAGGSVTTDGRITVTQRATEVLPPDEMRALLAHEVAHVLLRKNPSLLLAIPIVLLCGVLIFSAARIPYGRALIFAPMLVLMPIILLVTPRRMRRLEIDADRKAVELTGDPEALVRCLERMVAASPSPGYGAIDTASHPALARRLAAIRGEVDRDGKG